MDQEGIYQVRARRSVWALAPPFLRALRRRWVGAAGLVAGQGRLRAASGDLASTPAPFPQWQAEVPKNIAQPAKLGGPSGGVFASRTALPSSRGRLFKNPATTLLRRPIPRMFAASKPQPRAARDLLTDAAGAPAFFAQATWPGMPPRKQAQTLHVGR